MQRWVESREARQAVWQAGQILKLIRALPLETMNDFHLVVLYHGSLCLWTYGTITSRRCELPAAEAYQVPIQDVLLDGDESVETLRWILFDRGRSVISNPAYRSDVQSIGAVMQTCIQTIRSKYPSRIVLPPSTEGLCYLMHAFSTTARKNPNKSA